MRRTKITEKYQTTIPAEIRKALDIKAGQEVEWYAMRGRAMLEAPKKIQKPTKFLTGQIKLGVDAVGLVRKAREELG
jgi:AbrB family looped-hinge helix DNA binding protein